MAKSNKLRITVVGAGIAGLAAAIGLSKHEGIDIQIYERASQLHEVGASIALGPNGMRKLEKLGVTEALEDNLAFRNSQYPMIYKHWKTNETVSFDEHKGEVAIRHRTSRFYRVHLQRALAAHIEPSQIHFSKTFADVVSNPGSNELLISFTDGTWITTDILLGADGIHSAVRRLFVPSSAPKWTGWVAFRSVFDAKLVEHIPGALEEAVHWWGHDRTFFASKMGNDLYSIVGGNYSDPDASDAPYKDATWNSEGSLETLKDFYKDWHPTIKQLIEASPYIKQYPNTFASSLDSWIHSDGRITYAGDAAHAHGGAFAAGGSLALDDAYAFTRAIYHYYPEGSASKPTRQEISSALRLYERARKPHTDRVLSTVHANNKRAVERIGKPETDEELRMRMTSRADNSWIHEHDVDAAFAQALKEEEVLESRTNQASQARL